MESPQITRRFLVLIIVAVAVIGFFVFYLSFHHPGPIGPSSVSSSTSSGSLPPAGNLNLLRNTMLSQAKIIFPAVATTTAVLPETIPAQLSALVPPGYMNGTFEKVLYINGRKGYLIDYVVAHTMPDFYQDEYFRFSKSPDWQMTDAMKSDIFALIELQNKTYQVHVENTWIANGNDHILILALIK